MNKKTIISNTLLFAGILAFILAFGAVFGEKNILIGVSTITAMLMFLERDLTAHPAGNTVKLVLLNLVTGLAAYFSGFNMWLAIPIHFAAMFLISYSLIFNLKNPLYLPFSLQYLFMLAVPVTAGELPLRLGSLVVGAAAIMLLQVLFNSSRVGKNGRKLVGAACLALKEKIESMQNGESPKDADRHIQQTVNQLRSLIWDKREENFYLTDEGRVMLNLSASLEKLDALLRSADAEKNREMLADMAAVLNAAAKSTEKGAAPAGEEISELLQKYKTAPPDDLKELRMLSNLTFIKEGLDELHAMTSKQAAHIWKSGEVPEKFKRPLFGGLPEHSTSIKFSYAVRVSLGITVGAFLMDFFNLEEGRWMLFTILSVVIPLYEQSNQKMRDRIFATIVGAVLVSLLFMMVTSHTGRTILLLFAGYLMSYVKVYRYSTILVTFSAIGAAALITGETQILTVERLLMVAAGVLLALLLNRFIFPYKNADAINDLKDMYEDTIEEMIAEMREQLRKSGNTYSMKNLLVITSMIEERLHVSIGEEDEKDHEELLYRRLAASTLYELARWIDKYNMSDEDMNELAHVLQELQQTNDVQKEAVKAIGERTNVQPDLNRRIMWGIVLELVLELDKLKKSSGEQAV